MENKFLFDPDFQELSPFARLVYLTIKVANKGDRELHIGQLNRLAGLSLRQVRLAMREINENFDIYVLLDPNECITYAK